MVVGPHIEGLEVKAYLCTTPPSDCPHTRWVTTCVPPGIAQLLTSSQRTPAPQLFNQLCSCTAALSPNHSLGSRPPACLSSWSGPDGTAGVHARAVRGEAVRPGDGGYARANTACSARPRADGHHQAPRDGGAQVVGQGQLVGGQLQPAAREPGPGVPAARGGGEERTQGAVGAVRAHGGDATHNRQGVLLHPRSRLAGADPRCFPALNRWACDGGRGKCTYDVWG